MIEMLPAPIAIARLLVCLFFAACFLQSGFDKVFDWRGNLEWLQGHFAKTPARGAVPLLLGVVTVLEVSTGFLSAAAVVALVLDPAHWLPVAALGLAGLTLVLLFAGQRVAKDYAGAATLAAYFLVALVGLALSS
jgi:uncharacterized membrane protein YphA (DoxX/SURF4 family)